MGESGTPICAKDGFPKVEIAGRWQCVVEYLDHCIGGQCIVDLVKREDKVYYVFESATNCRCSASAVACR